VSARRALVTGVAGQDGSYLCELLVGRGYEVLGAVRPGRSGAARERLGAVAERLELVEADLLDGRSLRRMVAETAPDELYHLAAPTFVPASWEDPSETLSAIATATAMRWSHPTIFINASDWTGSSILIGRWPSSRRSAPT